MHLQDMIWVGEHSRGVGSLISQLLEAGRLRSLRVKAAHTSLRIDMSCLAASGLQHLSLECWCGLRLEGECDDDDEPIPSIHLFTWVRAREATWVRTAAA